ncbi:hypothetical protein [Spirillospora sp. CA-294931]|uniref:hypothetical protein n=1 Tax=Spirillospora sp. CA-294931 TaxID=3240042 RepID=UPI003D90D96C
MAREYGVHRRAAREALSSSWPKPRKSRLDPFKPWIDQFLRADLRAARKPRHTNKRVFDRLVAERELEGISYSTLCEYLS